MSFRCSNVAHAQYGNSCVAQTIFFLHSLEKSALSVDGRASVKTLKIET